MKYMKKIVIILIASLSVQGLIAQTLEDVKKAIFQEDFKKAKSMLQTLMSSGKKPEYHYYMGLVHLEEALDYEDDAISKEKELENAKKQFEAGIALKNKYPYNFLGLGRYYALKKNLAEAKINFQKAYELSGGSDLELIVELAEGYVEGGSKEFIEEATKLLTKAKTMDSKNANIYTALGDLWEKQNVYELALTEYKNAVNANPNLVKAHYKIGKLLLKEKKYNEGAEYFRKCIQLDPNFAPAYREMGELYFRAGRYKEAKDNYKSYVQKTAGDLQAQVRYCQFLYLSKEYQEAVNQINSVLKDTTTNVLLRLLGYSYVELKNYSEALNALDKYFARVKPENQIAKDYEYYAKALDNTQKDSLAVLYYEKAMQMDPNLNYYSAIGECWSEIKSWEKAVTAYEKAISINANPKDYYMLARAYQNLQNYDKAEEYYKKVTELKADFLPAYLQLAYIAGKKDPETKLYLAKPYYEKIIELTENEQEKYKKERARGFAYLAFYYYDTKDNPKAYKYAEKALQLDPNDKNSAQILDYLKKIGVKPEN
jgi:tetratricopeptide (TPR) repeat protein